MPINRPAAVTLDARSLSPATKTDQILEAFDKLQIGTALEINEETDPRALRNEMAQLRPGQFSWDARNLGSNRWTVRLERIDEHAERRNASRARAAVHGGQSQHDQGTRRPDERAHLQIRRHDFRRGRDVAVPGIVKTGKVIYTLLSPDGKTHTIGERLTHDTLNESGDVRRRRRDHARRSADRRHRRHASERSRYSRRAQRRGTRARFSHRVVAGSPPLDRHDCRPRVRARACSASRSFCSATRAPRSE